MRHLTGALAGGCQEVREFPCVIGQDAGAGVRTQGAGVFAEHATLTLVPREGFFLERNPCALASINGAAFDRQRLRNGDVLELGGVKLQFALAAAKPVSLRPREWVLWSTLISGVLFQVLLVYWLVR